MIAINKFRTYKFSELIQNPKMICFKLISRFNSLPISFQILLTLGQRNNKCGIFSDSLQISSVVVECEF